MARNEWSELLRMLDASSREREADASLLALLTQSFSGAGEGLDTSFLPRSASTARPGSSLGTRGADELLGLRTVAARPPAPVAVVNRDASERGDSTAVNVVKTIGTVTGVGPLVTGLMKLFGGGGSDAAQDAAPMLPFSLPEQISVEAGLAPDRSFVPVSYSLGGVARSAITQQPVNSTPATQVHVNVQAMDSRSFLDHSDDIARAVRDAMLRSHSLNDVVAEM